MNPLSNDDMHRLAELVERSPAIQEELTDTQAHILAKYTRPHRPWWVWAWRWVRKVVRK